MMASTPSPSRRVEVTRGDVGARCRPSRPGVLDRCAEHAASGVDLVDGELDTGELGWSEERQAAGLGEQRADLQHAVAFTLDTDRDQVDDRRTREPRACDETSSRDSIEAVVGAELEHGVRALERLAVAVEVERTGDAVVVDVGAGLDHRQAVGVGRALLADAGDADDLVGVGADRRSWPAAAARAITMTAS